MSVKSLENAIDELEEKTIKDKISAAESSSPFIDSTGKEAKLLLSNSQVNSSNSDLLSQLLFDFLKILKNTQEKDYVEVTINFQKISDQINELEKILNELHIHVISRKKMSIIRPMIVRQIKVNNFPDDTGDPDLNYRVVTLKIMVVDIMRRLISQNIPFADWQIVLFQAFTQFNLKNLLSLLKLLTDKIVEGI